MDMLTLNEVAKAVNGQIINQIPDTVIDSVSTNSNEISKNCLFIPIVGEKLDAHNFIDSAFENGAVASFSQKTEICKDRQNIILVNDTKKALQDLAKYYRRKFTIPIIGITGSVGKTSTKEMIYSVLSQQYKVFKTPGNFNSQIGVPLSILSIDKSYDLAIIEMGMSMFGEMKRLVDIVKPSHAVITNIGLSHIGNLKTQDNIFSEKFHIADFIEDKSRIYLNGDDKILSEFNEKNSEKFTTFGLYNTNSAYAYEISYNSNKTTFLFSFDNVKGKSFTVNAIGEHNVLNAEIAILLGLRFNISLDKIQKGVLGYKSPNMRQQIYKSKDICIIDDTYNASPDSVKSALSVLKSVGDKTQKIAVLADILELGEISEKTHFDLGYDVIKNDVDVLITIGKNAKNISNCVNNNSTKIKTYHFDDNLTAYKKIKSVCKDSTVLIKGSRGMKTDEIVKLLLKEFDITA